MIKNIKENIVIIIIVLLVIMSTLLIGTPIEEDNVFPIYIVFGIFCICYFLKRLIKKEKLLINKIDILISLIVFSAFMPLVGSSQASLSNTIYGIIRYFILFMNYIIVKEQCRKNDKYIDIIINTIIFSVLLLCFIGIDEINYNILENFKKVIGYKYIQYDEVRIGSLFAYPNTMAMTCGLGIFLCLRNIFKVKKKNFKILYFIELIFILITLTLTYSRLAFIILSMVMAIFSLILLKKYKVREKISKKVVIIVTSVVAILVTYVIIGTKISKKVKIEDEYQKIIYSAEGNKKYEFKFDITAKSDKEDFSIIITEKNKYFDDINKTEEKFGNFEGEKIISLHTKEDTDVIYINIKNENKNSEIIINNVKLNNEQFILEYKLLPTNIVDKISNISFNNKSAWERLTFIKDAFKIIKENWMFGVGSKAWQDMQYGVQEYDYFSNEVHSFLIQTFLENGIIGFLGCIGVFIYILKKVYSETKKEEIDISKISYLLGIIFMLTHSLLDFNMSFFYVSFIAFVLISIISSQEEKNKPTNGIILYIMCIIISIFSIYICIVKINFNKEKEILKINSIRTEEVVFSTYNQLLPFDSEVKYRYYQALNNKEIKDKSKIEKIIREYILKEKYSIGNLNLSNIFELVKITQEEADIEFIINYIKETKEFFKYQPELQLERLINMKEIIYILQENNNKDLINELKEQFTYELDYKEEYILNYQKCRYDKENVKLYKEKIEYLKILEE